MTASPRSVRALPIVTLLIAACSPGSGEQRFAFVETLGNDTLAVEVVTRTADRIEGDLVTRAVTTRRTRYVADLDSDGRIVRLQAETTTPPENPDGPPPESYTVTIVDGMARIDRVGGRSPGTEEVEVPDHVVPTVSKNPMAYGIWDHVVRQAHSQGADAYPLGIMAGPSGRVQDNALSGLSGAYSVSFFGNPLIAHVAEDGGVASVSGEQTTMRIETRRVEPFDVTALAAEFAARDARGEGIGVASPRDTARAEIAGASLEIDYGRPAKRGREIWGGLVPGDGEIWRTGANEATQFFVDQDIRFGERVLPAGAYTLWSTYEGDAATLIVNSQTGQWGTAYDSAMDLMALPMRAGDLAEPIERFEITIEPDGGGEAAAGAIVLRWDMREYRIPFSVN